MNTIVFIFPLPRDNQIEIRLRHAVTPKEYELVAKVFQLCEIGFLEEAPATEPIKETAP